MPTTTSPPARPDLIRWLTGLGFDQAGDWLSRKPRDGDAPGIRVTLSGAIVNVYVGFDWTARLGGPAPMLAVAHVLSAAGVPGALDEPQP